MLSVKKRTVSSKRFQGYKQKAKMYKQNDNNVYVLVQFYPWFDFYFLLFWV